MVDSCQTSILYCNFSLCSSSGHQYVEDAQRVLPIFSYFFRIIILALALSRDSRLGYGCGALRLGGVGVKWESRARKRGGELGGSRIQGDVDRPALCDERGGGVNCGFGLAPFQVEGCVPTYFIRVFQYSSSSARYTQVVISPSFAAPGTTRHMFWARFFLLFYSGAPRLRLLSHHAVRSQLGYVPLSS